MNNNALKRSNNGIIAGVMQGIANTYGWDVSIVRLLFIAISVFSAAFPGIIVYLILWAVIPKEY